MANFNEAIENLYGRTRPNSERRVAQELMYHFIGDCARKLKAFECDSSNDKRLLRHLDPTLIPQTSWSVFMIDSRSRDLEIGVYINFKITWNDKERLLIKLSQIISKNDPQRSLLVRMCRSQYPVIQITDIESKSTTSVSICEYHFYQKNELIKKYIVHHTASYSRCVSTPECIDKLIVFVDHWSKCRGICNVFGYLNSFGFVVMVIKFVQWFEAYKLETKASPWSLSDLLYEFYVFYVYKFDWDLQCVSIIRLPSVWNITTHSVFDYKREPYTALQIIDPVNTKHNIAQNVDWNRAQHIKYEFIRSVSIFERGKTQNTPNIYLRLCDTNADLVTNCTAKVDPFGNIHFYYESFEHSKKVGKDIRYQYDPKAKYILTRVPKNQNQNQNENQNENQEK